MANTLLSLLKKWGLKIFITLLVLYLIVGVLATIFQEKMLFNGKKLKRTHNFDFAFTFEERWLKQPLNDSSALLHALYFPSEMVSKGTVLYFHGNTKNLQRWGEEAKIFLEKGYNVLMPDYRGFGKSKGERKESKLYDDAQQWYQYLREQEGEIPIVYGRSLGTTFATFVAAHNPCQTLILEAPFYSAKDIARRRFPIYPTAQLMRWEFPTYSFLDRVKCPVHIFHGTKDKIVPYKSGLKLKAFLKTNDAFISLKGVGHRTIPEQEQYREGLERILRAAKP